MFVTGPKGHWIPLSGLGGCGLGGTSYASCTFADKGANAPSQKYILALQEILRERGAAALKADGWWGPCSESTFQKVFGEPLTKESLSRHVGVECAIFKKNIAGTACADGSDYVAGVPSANASVRFGRFSVTPGLDPTKIASIFAPKTTPGGGTTPGSAGGGTTRTGAAAASIVPGVSNTVLAIGAIAVAAGVIYYMKRK